MVVPENELARPEQIDQFYKAIKLCRTIYDRPFIKLDHLPQLAAKRLELTFQDWRRARREIKLANELINHEDEVLVDRGIEYLIRAYGQTQAQFCHGHLSCRDVRWTKDKEMAVLSNLYWSYRIPDYDLTFGWHWRRLSLLANPRLGMKAVEVEQPMWQRNMGEVRLARLERALAGLNLDITMVAHLPKAEYELVRQMYRAEILDLMN